jgi:hypothetical protein
VRAIVLSVPAWLVALLVALVGAVFGLAGALIGTFARIAHERVADLRTRMLDAADDFVMAVTLAHEAVESAALPTGLWVEIAWMDLPEEMSEDRQARAEKAHAAASTAWEVCRQRVPRVALLFGVDSPATKAARLADKALGATIVALSADYGRTFDSEADPPAENLVVERAARRLAVATSALRTFSATAHTAIAGERWTWRRLLSP